MAISQMQKVQLYVYENRITEVLHSLQKMEIIEITDVDEDFIVPQSQSEARAVGELVDFLQKNFPDQKTMIENFINVLPVLDNKELQAIIKQKAKLNTLLKVGQALQGQRNSLLNEVSGLQAELARYETLRYFPIAPRKLQRLSKVKSVFGFISKSALAKLQVPQQAELEIYADTETLVYLGFFYFTGEDAFFKELQRLGFKEVTFPETKAGYVADYQRIKKQLALKEKAVIANLADLKKFHVANRAFLAAWADHLSNQDKVGLWSKNLLETKRVGLIEGWVRRERWLELDKFGQSKDILLTEAVHSADDQPPVALANSKLNPLEAVTTIYGFPNTQEFDPTPILGIFFIVFYGLCLSDAGYGLMLILFAMWLQKKYKSVLTKYGKQLLKLNLWCGLSTIVVGILSGSYFGMDLGLISFVPVRAALLSFKIMDPIANPLPMLIMSFVLGIIQLYTGLMVRFLIDIKQQGLNEALLGSGVWVYFASGMIGWGLSALVFSSIALGLFKFITYSGAILLVLTQGRHHKSWPMRLGSGLLSLYRLSGFLGDILSYSRLFALGLTTSVLAMVINLLAGLTWGIPIIGPLIMLLILVVGHIFDFLINILGSFVHSARLQYVEFFSKFFEGGGREFKPFKVANKYTVSQ